MRRKWLSLTPLLPVTQVGQHTRDPVSAYAVFLPVPSSQSAQTAVAEGEVPLTPSLLIICLGRLGRLAGMDGEKNSTGSKKQDL